MKNNEDVKKTEEMEKANPASEPNVSEETQTKPEPNARTVAKYSDEDLDRIINAKVAKLMEKQEKKSAKPRSWRKWTHSKRRSMSAISSRRRLRSFCERKPEVK
ncbi:MAG: hypothetical protein SOW48_03285 [Peptoniphilaceae bacterium]|nr:hypothetical protein [Peptoniphilaceae bacterium]MDY3075652.1 hypothetical protein [Peptoniphilaceae bacterium]